MAELRASTERNVHDNILGVIGRTPLVRLARVAHHVVGADLRQAREPQSRWKHQGPGRAVHHRAG